MAKKVAAFCANAVLGYALALFASGVLGVMIPFLTGDAEVLSARSVGVLIVAWTMTAGLTTWGFWFAERS